MEGKQEKYDKEYAQSMVRRFLPLAIVAIVAAVGIIIFYFCVKRYAGLKEGLDVITTALFPIIIGFVLAFLMNPMMMVFERKILPFFLKKSKNELRTRKNVRILTTLISMIILWGIIILFFVSVLPELYNTIAYLVNHIMEQIYGVLDWANEITGGRYEEQILGAKNDEKIMTGINNVVELAKSYFNVEDQDQLIELVTSVGLGVGRFIVNILIAIFVSVYVLLEKEKFKGQAKKLVYGFFPTKAGNVVMEVLRKTNDIFYGFIIGKIIDSFIIGVICYVVMQIIDMPYPLLTSVIIGVTNIIPVFGPYIGAIPTVIIIFLTEPRMGIYFLIFVLILQQIDGNLIGPKILGDSTGISSFWVVFAIVVGGSLFGFLGMLLGVPTVAVIYYICGRISRFLLRKRKLPEDTGDYIDLDHVDEKTLRLIPKDPEKEAARQKAKTPKFLKKKEE
ncbi:MAG: AI-2E family transporter [Lachnospiraceae bacterium]|nr:AI-2E family transporter [Lachnospiraceae bacterium]